MKNGKLILIALAILLAAIAVWVVVGFVFTIVKFLFVLAIVVFGISIFSKLFGKSNPQQLEGNTGDRELNEAMRQMEEIKRRQQLTK